MTQPPGESSRIDKRPRKTDRRQGIACYECKIRRQKCSRTSLHEICFSCTSRGLPCDVPGPAPSAAAQTVAIKKRKPSSRQPAWKLVRDSFGLPSNVSPTATPAKLFNSELAASMSTHLLTLFLALKGDVPMLHWRAFEYQVNKSHRRVGLLSPSAQVLSAVVEALGARISDHSHIVGTAAPVLLDLTTYRITGRDISIYGRMRKPIYETLLLRAIKLADEHAIYRKPNAYSVAAFMLLDWLTTDCAFAMDHNPNHTFGRLALSHIGTIIKKPESHSILAVKLMGGLAGTYESLTVARTGDQDFIRDFEVVLELEHYRYEVDAKALIMADGIDRIRLVANVQPLLFTRVAELNRMCGRIIVKPYLAGKEVDMDAIEELFDLLEDYHRTLGMFSARLIALPKLEPDNAPEIQSLRRACDHWITYDIFGAANVTFLMYETLMRSAGVSSHILQRCYQAMYYACRVVLARVKMEVFSDPLKACEPGRAYQDIDLIADFLDGLKLADEGGPPDFTAEERMDDLETLKRTLQYRGWAVPGLKPRIDRIAAYIEKYTPAHVEPSLSAPELQTAQNPLWHSSISGHANIDTLARAASDRAVPAALRQAPLKTPSETSHTSSDPPAAVSGEITASTAIGNTLPPIQPAVYPAVSGIPRSTLPPRTSTDAPTYDTASQPANGQSGPSHPYYYAPNPASHNIQSDGIFVPSIGKYIQPITQNGQYIASGQSHNQQGASQQQLRYYSYEAAEEMPPPAPEYDANFAAQGYEQVNTHHLPTQQYPSHSSYSESAMHSASISQGGTNYIQNNGDPAFDARYQDFAVRHIQERHAVYNAAN